MRFDNCKWKVTMVRQLAVAGSIVLFLTAIMYCSPEAKVPDRREAETDAALARHLVGFELRAPSLVDALLELGKRTNQPMGIEYVDDEALQNPVHASVPDGTLDEGLRTILGGREGYSWHVKDGVVLITNARAPKGRNNLLDTLLPTFSTPRCSPQEAGNLLYMNLGVSLHPGVGVAGDYRPGLTGMRVGPMQMKNVSVRQVLNRIASEAGQLGWVVQVSPSEMSQHPSSGFWLLVDYHDASLMGHVGALIRQARAGF
jgi:hypothetical protein